MLNRKPGSAEEQQPYISDDGALRTSSSDCDSDFLGPGESMSSSTSPAPQKKKSGSDLLMRTVFTVLTGVMFVLTQHVGQTLGIVLVFTCQILMFREVMRISQKKNIENELPGFHNLPWFMFFVCCAFTIATALRVPLVKTWPFLEQYLKHLTFAAFCFYMVGLIAFVLSLKPMEPLKSVIGKLRITRVGESKKPSGHQRPLKQVFFRYQFSQFGWLHMGLFAFSLMSSLFYFTMMEAMLWFTLPVSCVINNDSWAFACGKLFGKVPLIPTLSPKKTWEGFLGAWFFTTLWAFWFSDFLSSSKRFVCPKVHFLQPIDCEVSSTFLLQSYAVPEFLQGYLGEAFMVKPVQLHGIAFAAFASLGAPFGGFFASGLKRAFNLKDFGDLIPGHGGVVDRMDCQILMALFVYCYVSNFVLEKGGICAATSMFSYCFSRMDPADQVLLYNQLGRQLSEEGIRIVDGIAQL
ncbi:Phosphatidate cytidylyltransferase 2 [Diplonema papillatum]|nr:Phosphatidate cytidylyltransferase 2 [Diplonema papillatum]